MNFRFSLPPRRKNSVRDKAIGKKWVYLVGTYQSFLPDTMMLLLRCTVWSSLILIGCSVIVIAMLLSFIGQRRLFAVKKLSAQIFFILMAFTFLYVSMFIIACV